MQRSALLLMALSTMLVLGDPQLAAEEAQRGRARSRGNGQVTAAPHAKSLAPSRAARRVSSNRTGKSTGARSTSPPKTSAPRRAPGVQSSAPRTGRPNSGTAVGRARPRHSVSPPRSKVTIVTNGRVTATRPTRRVVGGPSTAVESNARRTGRPNTPTAGGRARARDTVTAPSAGRVTVTGRNRTTSHTRARRRVVETGNAASTTTTADVVRVGRGSRSNQAQVVRRPPGDINVVGRAVPRMQTPLITSPGYGVSGRAGHGSGYGSNHRYGYNSFGYRIGGRGHHTAPHVSLHHRHRHVYYPGYVQPRLYGSFFYFPGYSFSLGVGFGSGHGYGYGYGYGYGHYSYGYSGYAYPSFGAYSPYGHLSYTHLPSLVDPYTGFLRLKVRPRDAQVYVDGYYVGIVDEFDGVFQRLRLEKGPHQIEIRHPAHLPFELEVLIVTGEKVTFEGELYQP